jgi:DNA end-binding protein Ku
MAPRANWKGFLLDLAKHIVNQKSATFDPEKFEDHYEAALTELINQERSGKTIAAKPPARRERRRFDGRAQAHIGQAERATPAKGKKRRKAAAGQKEMLLPISSKRAVNEEPKRADKRATTRGRKSA